MRRVRSYRALLEQYGLRRCLFRLAHDLRRKYGLLERRFPVWSWEDRPLETWTQPGVPTAPAEFRSHHAEKGGTFFFPMGKPPRVTDEQVAGAVAEVQALREGRFRYFSHRQGELGFPPADWTKNPFTGQTDPAEGHWCSRGDFSADRGDVKYIWEPSRFGWAYALGRAYAAEPRDEYAEMFWQLVESWMAANPPQIGPNWMCGQEIAIRVMACTFGLYVFTDSPATTDERFASMVVMLAGSAERIAGNINAARNQMGNHATSEAAGLYTVGVLFPELAKSGAWREHGEWVLEDEVREHNWTDGSYTQHSTNYQRLMLHTYLWCLRLAQLNGLNFSKLLEERIAASYRFLYQLQDDTTGRVPNYGPNDGACVLPLSDAAYLDYRPVLGSLHYLFTQERLYEDGGWSEDLTWLFGEQADRAPVAPLERQSSTFDVGGYDTFRGRDAWAMVRCHSYRTRPNQADMLHLDLWWQGVNLLRDSGTYSYYDPSENWNQYFLSTAAHNTVVVGDAEQMIKGPRFQWFSLVQSRFLGRAAFDGGRVELWAGEHYGYRRLGSKATHRRTILRIADSHWIVVDDIFGSGAESATLHWQLPACPWEQQGSSAVIQTEQGVCRLDVACSADDVDYRILEGYDEAGVRGGWESLYYGEKHPAPTMCVAATASLPIRFVTVVTLGGTGERIECDPRSHVNLAFDDAQIALTLNPPSIATAAMGRLTQDDKTCELAY